MITFMSRVMIAIDVVVYRTQKNHSIIQYITIFFPIYKNWKKKKNSRLSGLIMAPSGQVEQHFLNPFHVQKKKMIF